MNLKSFFIIALLFVFSFSSCDKCCDQGQNSSVDSTFVFGVDLSYVNQIEDHGGVYKKDGKEADPFELFANSGSNYVRLRLWNNPNWIYNIYGDASILYSAFEDVRKSVKRAKDKGMKVNLDFHFSDNWADPGHQRVPNAWVNISDINVLADSIYNYTYKVLNNLASENLLPEMLQLGNETNCGMLYDEASSSFPELNICDGNWVNYGKILNSAIKAVRDVDEKFSKKTEIMLHIADPKNLDWFFSNIKEKALVTDYDIIGVSYYYNWHTTVAFSNLKDVFANAIKKIKKELIVVETAYPFTTASNDSYNNILGNQAILNSYAYSREGQLEYLKALTQIIIDAGGRGIFYWEPAWITSNMQTQWGTGSAWENNAFFDYDGNFSSVAEGYQR